MKQHRKRKKEKHNETDKEKGNMGEETLRRDKADKEKILRPICASRRLLGLRSD